MKVVGVSILLPFAISGVVTLFKILSKSIITPRACFVYGTQMSPLLHVPADHKISPGQERMTDTMMRPHCHALSVFPNDWTTMQNADIYKWYFGVFLHNFGGFFISRRLSTQARKLCCCSWYEFRNQKLSNIWHIYSNYGYEISPDI